MTYKRCIPFLVMIAMMCFLMPIRAYASEEGAPHKGVLTLCENPFVVDSKDADRLDAGAFVVDGSVSYETGDANAGNDVNDAGDSCAIQETECSNRLGLSEAGDGFELDRFDSGDALEDPVRTTLRLNCDNFEEQEVVRVASIYDSSAECSSKSKSIEESGLYESGTILAEIAAGMDRATLELLVESAGGLSMESVDDEDLAYGLVKLCINDGATVLETIDRLRGLSGFINLQPNYLYRVENTQFITVNDPWASNQWALKSVGASDAWALARTGGSVAVAIIDTGADLDHPDLAGNIVATHNSVSDNNTVEDQVGHGTHVAGIVAGVANNKTGVAGVSYNANLVIIKASAFKSLEFNTSSIVRAYAWLESYDSSGKTVAEHYNVRVVNLSIGGLDETRKANLPDEVLNKAIIRARDEFGLLTVCAAGNAESIEDLPYATYPGDSEGCISVMNLCNEADETNEVNGVSLEESSNYNPAGSRYKDICAPGTSIYSTWLNDKYASSKGTSMAAPLVSGIAALLFAAKPTLTPLGCIGVLEATAIDLGEEGWDERYGYGEVNAADAVRMVNGAILDGWDVVGVRDTASYFARLGWGMSETEEGWTWSVEKGDGNATINSSGILTGRAEGDVTVKATCTATTGAQISATKKVYIVEAEIIGNDALKVGECSSEYKTDDPKWTWVWKVEESAGSAHIDQDAILHADRPGTVYVTATCTSNTNIVLRKKVVIEI